MMRQYHDLLNHILMDGLPRDDRTGVGTLSVFGYQMRFDLSEGFPLVTTKKMHVKSIIHELLWFLRGDTNIKYLNDHGVHIWDEWADKNGNLGPIYGKQFRNVSSYQGMEFEYPYFDYIDQIKEVINLIKTDPSSRRMIVSAWNVGEVPDMALPPCHCLFQFYVSEGKLSCQLYQRSGDAFLGVPFNIASYALLTHMIAQVCGLQVGEFIHTFGDVHIYKNHIEQCKEQLSRNPKVLPSLWLNPVIKDIDHFKYEDIRVCGYDSWPSIKGDVAV